MPMILGMQEEEAREELRANADKTEGAGSLQSHWKLWARAGVQTPSFQVAEIRPPVLLEQCIRPQFYWNNEYSKFKYSCFGVVGNKFSSTQKEKRMCFHVISVPATITNKP